MRTALLHYWLTNRRGGENVFREICSMFPDGDIFTHSYNPSVMDAWFGGRRVRETFVGRLPFAHTKCQVYLPLMFAAARQIPLDGYDLVISSEAGPIKGVRKPSGTRHVCYCHSPMRYLWDLHDDYYRMAGLGGRLAMRLFTNSLRKADLRSAESVDLFIANSHFIADRIRRVYGRDAKVVHPMVNYAFFSQGHYEKKDYYLLAGQNVTYKRPELAVAACLRMNRRLVVVGAKTERLQQLANGSPLVTLRGRVSDEELRRFYAESRALLFPGLEDFGIVPLEAQAAGTPVIAYGRGGALETVVKDKTGLFFDEQTVESLCAAIETFEASSSSFGSADCRARAAQFTPENFRSAFRAAIEGQG